MLLRILFVLICTAVAVFGATEEVNKTFAVSPGGRLVVDVDFGSIEVTAGADDKVEVHARREVEMSSEEREREYFTAVPLELLQDGNTVTVRAVRKDKNRDSWSWSRGRNRTRGRYTIKVPKNFSLSLDTAGGNIEARDVTGPIKADTSGGNLEFANINGPVEADTSGGHIEVNRGSGKLDLETSGGHIEVKDYQGDTLVETSGGGLKLHRINGRVVGETSGGSIDAVLTSPVSGDVRLETSGGSIRLAVPADAGLDVKADTSAGRVSTDLPFEGTRDSDSMAGKINGGGKSVVLDTSAGSIQIVAASAESAAL